MNTDTCIGCPSYDEFLIFRTTCRILQEPDRFFNSQHLISNCPCKECIVKPTCMVFCKVYDKHCYHGLMNNTPIHITRI